MGKRILLVEDYALIAKAEAIQLRKAGYEVTHVLNGEKAIEIMKADNQFDLILMDIDLGSGIDGTHAAQEILKYYNIPIVFLSSHTEKEMVEKTEKITSYGYVVKNSGITVLDASIKMAFKLFEAQNSINKQKINIELINKELLEVNKVNSQLINSVEEGIVVYGTDLRYKIWNHFVEDLTGISSDKVLGKHPLEVFPHLRNSGVLDSIEKALSGEKTESEEYSYTSPHNNKTRLILNTCLPLKNSLGDITGVILIIQDITKNKQIQENLQHSEQRFRSAFETAAHGMAMVGTDGAFLQINQSFCDIIGYDKKELLNMDFQKITHPEDLDLDLEYVKKLLSGELKNYKMEKRYYHKNGSIIWVLLSVSIVNNKYDLPLHFISQVIDITERKLSEEKIKNEQKFSSGLISAMRDGFSLVDNKGIQTDVNESFCQMTGFSREELIGTSAPFPYWPPEEYENINKAFQRSLELDFENFELIFLRKNGERFPVIVSPAPLYDSKGNITNFLATVKDITDRKIVEKEKQKLLEEKDLLLKEVHHRTKNNMNVMMSLLSIQANKISDHSAIEILKDANKRMKSMMILYDKLYNTNNFKELPVNEFLSSLIDELSNIFPDNGLIKINRDIGDFILDVETLLPLGIIINELMTNSIKYAFVEKINNEINILAFIKGTKVNIIFEDNGCGLSRDIDIEKSSGLGLMLVGELSKQINSNINIERDNGTKFIFEFDYDK